MGVGAGDSKEVKARAIELRGELMKYLMIFIALLIMVTGCGVSKDKVRTASGKSQILTERSFAGSRLLEHKDSSRGKWNFPHSLVIMRLEVSSLVRIQLWEEVEVLVTCT
jgi:hypothetical protein